MVAVAFACCLLLSRLPPLDPQVQCCFFLDRPREEVPSTSILKLNIEMWGRGLGDGDERS